MKITSVAVSVHGTHCQHRGAKFAASWLTVTMLLVSLWASDSAAVEIHEYQKDLSAQVGKQVEIEGRFRSAGAGKLYLVDSPIEFQLGQFAGQVRRSMQGIVVEGQLTRGLPRPVFRVESFRALPPDLERFAQMRGRITPGNYQSLYALARWGGQQARWYHDRALKRASAEAFREAFAWAAEEAGRLNDVDRLLYLATWGEATGLAPERANHLRHQVCLLLVKRGSAADPQARLAAAERVRELLPGTDVPLAAERLDWAAKYLADPAGIWAELSRDEQRQAARALWAHLVAGAFERQGTQLSGDQLDSLIALAKQEIPDRPDTIRQLRLLAVRQRAALATTLTRAELLRLRDDLAELQEEAASRAVVERWLQTQRQGLASNDAEGRLMLADEYRELLADRSAAANLLIEALRIVPDLGEARMTLGELGYTERGGTWIPPTDKSGENQSAPAAEPPALAAGVPEATVLARLRRPDRVARVATQNSISEQWIYDGPPALHIFLRRSTVTGQAFVTRIEGGTP
ncbi:MAG: hypothetical protein KF708_09270 [Pirellulales bacterium]|nr:hypothetical protein [Pirellulales bacterium]